MCRMCRQRIGGHTWPSQSSRPTLNRSSPVSHDGVPNNAQYRAPESNDISNAHVSGNEEE